VGRAVSADDTTLSERARWKRLPGGWPAGRLSGSIRSVEVVERIAVIGCGGAGKTVLANELGRRLGMPVLHVDALYWQERPGVGRVESTPEQWRAIHEHMISSERWVIDGMKLGVLPQRLVAADTAVFLDLPTRQCLAGVLKRRLRYRGRLRPDIGVYDRINGEFIRWILSFRRRVRPRVLELLDSADCRVVTLTSHREAAAFLNTLPAQAPKIAD
jgi:adenylate kinase family enzyme